MKPKKEVILGLINILKKGDYQFRLKKYLTDQNIPEAQHDELIAEAREIYNRERTKKRKIIWGISAIFTFVLFYFILPVSITNKAPFVLSIVGAAAFTFFLAQFIADFKSWGEFNTKDVTKQNWRHKVTPFCVIPGLVMAFILFMHFYSNEKNELKKYGERTTGVIIDGTSIKNRRGAICNVTVKFTTLEGRVMIITESVGKDDFEKIYKGQTVDLVYSKKDPSIIEIVLNDVTAKSLFETEERKLNVDDLMQLLTCNNTEADSILSKLSFGWKYKQESGMWINEKQEIAVQINQNISIAYILVSSFMESSNITDQLLNFGFKKIGVNNLDNSDVVRFESEQFSAYYKQLKDDDEEKSIENRFQKTYLLLIERK